MRPTPELARDEGLWVRSEVMPDGSYAVTISADADVSWVLGREQALEYGRVAMEAAQRAEYDAAVFTLLTRRLGLDMRHAATFLGTDLRPDRAPLHDAATAPLRFEPGVNTAGKPFVTVHLMGEPWGQLGLAGLREHAMTVLEAPAGADLDAGLLRALRSMDVAEEVARQVVADISSWRAA